MPQRIARRGFTLIELLVVIAIIATLISILLPSLSSAKQTGIATKCLSQLRVLGQGQVIYSNSNDDVLVPGRLPRVDDCTWQASIMGGVKYRPTFLTLIGSAMGLQAFQDPQPCRGVNDAFGEAGDKQNYSSPMFVCPTVPDWTDERNGSYGYNYQFIGNSRLLDTADIYSFKNWPVVATRIRDTARTVAVADAMGTAATVAANDRQPYQNNGSGVPLFGNEGFNLDPPRIAPANGEAAGYPSDRTGVDPRHLKRANVVWVDGHADGQTTSALGYHINDDGSYALDGDNSLWSGKGQDIGWTTDFRF